MQALLITHGRNPDDWLVTVHKQIMPIGYRPRAGGPRPETPLIHYMAINAPAFLLNHPMGTRSGRPPKTPQAGPPYHIASPWGPGGVTPLRYLGDQLGVSGRPKWSVVPPTTAAINPYALVPVGSTDVPFALYLLRAMKNKRNLNPSAPAIEKLYADWLAVQPAGYASTAPSTISTVHDALSVPDVQQWAQQVVLPAQAPPPTTP